MPPGWCGEPVKIGEHMPHDGGHMRSRSIPDDQRAAPRPTPEALQSRPRKSAQSHQRTTETPAGTLQKIPPEAAASGGKIIFSRLVAKSAAAWHIGYKSKTETRKEKTK